MCATDSWGAHESFMHPIFVLKNGCDIKVGRHLTRQKIEFYVGSNQLSLSSTLAHTLSYIAQKTLHLCIRNITEESQNIA
jgi:hypothetical protein